MAELSTFQFCPVLSDITFIHDRISLRQALVLPGESVSVIGHLLDFGR